MRSGRGGRSLSEMEDGISKELGSSRADLGRQID